MVTSKQSTECAFCAIVSGDAPARIILNTDHALAFLPDVPAVLGHTLIVPKKHASDIWAVDRQMAYALADATRWVSSAVTEATNAEGLNIIQSNGKAAGQSVFHLHVHIVPRKEGDRMPSLWPEDENWAATQLDSVANDLRLAVTRHR